ncbi:MAG: hypothetical protein MPI95_07730 [Nitrosopumilus sp.]|nr:hypothetical protein [Nitrosopumilus sp.]MDA7943421.1 hypothetical protein [Nitrosopumilus sp.]MDA7958953.1 hypothetical protein [Nitrosopumilus sp.]MDA7959967.1 hypothetical protein [Nitrosopumilus sp.]MDA7999621.1 hypothetical protein [Nitrosopumilus sp.]
MKTEYEEFESVEDVFMYMAAASVPMKNTMPVHSYKGYVCALVPLSPTTGESYLMIYSRGSLDPGIYEFDVSERSYKKVEKMERADKFYFVSLTPRRNTIVDSAISGL